MDREGTTIQPRGFVMVLLVCIAAFCLFGGPAIAQAEQPNPLDHAALATQEAQEAGSDLKERATGAWSWTSRGYVAEDGSTIIPGALAKGIDVSEHQGAIDWEAVKADGITFAILRVGYGGDYSSQDDKTFAYNVSECERLGIPYGVYLYSYAYSPTAAASEAAHTLRLLEGHSPTYPVYYDLEYTYNGSPAGHNGSSAVNISLADLAEFAEIYCSAIADAGYTPGIYASLYWWNTYLTDSVFDSWERWVAQYPLPGGLCSYQGEYKMWQAASDASVAGVDGNVDVNFDYYPYRGGANFMRGDLNLNGKVNIVDAQIVYDLACNAASPVWQQVMNEGVAWTRKTVRYLADTNNDGFVDALDAQAVQSAALRGSW